MVNYVEMESMTCAVLGEKLLLLCHMGKTYIHKTHKQQGTASLTHAHSERHIFTHTVGQHMARTTQEGVASLKNNENSTAAWCCTAGRAAPHLQERGLSPA